MKRDFSNCRIISFLTQLGYLLKNNYKIDKKKTYRNFLFLNHVYDIQNFKKSISQNIFICGYPKYEKEWLKKIASKKLLLSHLIKKDKNIIFVSYNHFDDGQV